MFCNYCSFHSLQKGAPRSHDEPRSIPRLCRSVGHGHIYIRCLSGVRVRVRVFFMDSYTNSRKRIRDCVDGIESGKRSCASADGKAFLALLEDHLEGFDPDREEENLRLAGKEQLIGNVMKSLEREIGPSASAFVGAANCCLQSDSAVSMATSTSRLSDPEQLNMGNECTCTGGLAEKYRLGCHLLEACNYSGNEESGTVPISLWSGEHDVLDDCLKSDEADDLGGGLERAESSACGSTELLDLDAWDLGGFGLSEEGFKTNLELPTF